MLDALAGRLGTKGKLKGEVRFNGKTIGAQLRRKVLSYVAQEDTLYGNFTVLETLKFAARFHYGYTISHAEVTERADVLVERLGLSSCANTIVGDLFRKGLSGELGWGRDDEPTSPYIACLCELSLTRIVRLARCFIHVYICMYVSCVSNSQQG
jgi:hypothetical protein